LSSANQSFPVIGIRFLPLPPFVPYRNLLLFAVYAPPFFRCVFPGRTPFVVSSSTLPPPTGPSPFLSGDALHDWCDMCPAVFSLFFCPADFDFPFFSLSVGPRGCCGAVLILLFMALPSSLFCFFFKFSLFSTVYSAWPHRGFVFCFLDAGNFSLLSRVFTFTPSDFFPFVYPPGRDRNSSASGLVLKRHEVRISLRTSSFPFLQVDPSLLAFFWL